MNDLKFAFRQLLKNPGFTAVAVLTLALGIGANTAIFSAVNALLLRPLGYPESDRLVWISEGSDKSREFPISFPDFVDWQAQQTVFDQIGVYNWGNYNLVGSGEPLRLRAGQMSASAFEALRTQPTVGRVFTREEDRPGGPHVVVLSHRLWQERFGGTPTILNQALNLDGTSYTVIGVMPAGFAFPTPVDIWVPLAPFSSQPWVQDRGSHPGLEGVARLKAGVKLERAKAEMDMIAKRLEKQYPDSNKDVRVRLDPLLHKVVGNVSRSFWTLQGAVALVLLIACANVANLLLARAVGRQKEMAVRAALGAGRWQIARQLWTEGLLLTLIGSTFGVLFAHSGLGLIADLGQNSIPRVTEIHLDGRVLLFTAVAAVITGLLFGLVPLWEASRPRLQVALQEGSRGSTRGHSRLRHGLVVTEVALTLMLLIGAGLVLRSFHNLQTVNPGFSSERVLSFRLDLPERKYGTPDRQNGFYQALVDRLRALPGVQAAGVASRCPLESFNWLSEYQIEGEPEPAAGQGLTMDVTLASPDYFRALGIPLKRGRVFTDQDNRAHLRGNVREQEKAAALNVIVVDEEFVHRHWPNEDPLGKKVRLPWGDRKDNPVLTVVGVVGRVKVRELSEHGGFVQAYLPAWQLPEPGRAVVVKTEVPPETLTSAVREQVHSLDPDQPVSNLRTVEELRSNSLAPQRLNLILLGLFGVVAITLAAIGLYGVLAYAVTQRRREIGVRMALGAQKIDVLSLVLRSGIRMTLAGLGLGLLAALSFSRLMGNLLYDVKPSDPLTYVVVSGLLLLVGLLACWLPARQAIKVDPIQSLRYE